jgi:hypothetical protein
MEGTSSQVKEISALHQLFDYPRSNMKEIPWFLGVAFIRKMGLEWLLSLTSPLLLGYETCNSAQDG